MGLFSGRVSGVDCFKQAVLAFVALTIIVFSTSVASALAQGAGISIKPAKYDPSETIDPGSVITKTISVTNLSSIEQDYYLFIRNIETVDGGGVPVFATENSEVTGFELSDWIELSVDKISIPGNGASSFDYTLSVPENASPGSHFGGVFVSVKPPEIENSGAAVGYQVAHTLDVRVTGDAIEQANIRQFSTGKYIYGSSKVDFSVRIENTGNVMVKPRGPLEIHNMFGKKVSDIIFNDTESGVFPYTTREFSNIVWESDTVGFGRYEAVLSPIYGDAGAKQTMSSTAVFWILPMNIIGPSLGILATILLIVFIFVRLYIRRSLQHLNHGRRLVRSRRRGGSSATLLLTVVLLTVTALFLIVLLALFA